MDVYIYGPEFQPPSPRPWSWVSHSTVPLPPCGVVGVWYCPLPLPVVWWGCGTVPPPPCGVVGVWYCAHIYI